MAKQTRSKKAIVWGAGLPLFFIVILIFACQLDSLLPDSNPDAASNRISSLKIKPGPKMNVAIYDFQSSVPEIASRGATDMFVTSLVNSGAFAIAERQRLESGVGREKALQRSKQATGQAGGGKLTGADCILEGTISEFDAEQRELDVGVSVGGMETKRSSSAKTLGLDVRIINASTGKVIDSVSVRRQIKDSSIDISSVGNMIRSLTNKASGIDPDLTIKKTKHEGVDKALRECINEAVYQLVKRYMSE